MESTADDSAAEVTNAGPGYLTREAQPALVQ